MKRQGRSNAMDRQAMDRQLAWEWHPAATVSTNEAAALLNVSHDTVLTLIHTGTLEARRKSHIKRSRLLVYLDSVERLAESWRQQVLGDCAAIAQMEVLQQPAQSS